MTEFARLGIVAFAFGAFLLLIALVGGGVELKELRFGQLSRAVRGVLGGLGLVFVVLGVWVTYAKPPMDEVASASTTPSSPAEGPSSVNDTGQHTTSPSSPTDGTSPPPPPPTTQPPAFPTAQENSLLTHIPASIARKCERAADYPDPQGELQPAVICDPVEPGADYITYVLFEDQQRLEENYDNVMIAKAMTRESGSCAHKVPAESNTVHANDNTPLGRLMCFRDGGRLWFVWYHNETRVLAFAERIDGNRATLYAWWTKLTAGPI